MLRLTHAALIAAKNLLMEPALKGPRAGLPHAFLHRTVPWCGNEDAARHALGFADLQDELRVVFGQAGLVRLLPTCAPTSDPIIGLSCSPSCMGPRQRRRGLVPLCDLGDVEIAPCGGGVIVNRTVWRTFQCFSRPYPTNGQISCAMTVAWDAPDHATASVSAEVDDSPARAVHEFELSSDYSNVVLGSNMFPREPWHRCSSGTFAAIPTAFLTLVKRGHKTGIPGFLEVGAKRGLSEAALTRVITLLSAAFSSHVPSDETERINSALLACTIALEEMLSGSASDICGALTGAISGADAETVLRWALAANPSLEDAIGGIFATIIDRAWL